jgi:hypothetical protein
MEISKSERSVHISTVESRPCAALEAPVSVTEGHSLAKGNH